jgi:hypothetical protein
MASGHLEKVLETLDEGVIQTLYDAASWRVPPAPERRGGG